MTESNDRKIADDSKISEDRREALRYALAIGSGAALAATVSSPAAAQSTPEPDRR
jgi:polar amino acid transport system substrate-binding protein